MKSISSFGMSGLGAQISPEYSAESLPEDFETSVAVFIGRFQIPHFAHLSFIRRGLRSAKKLIIVLGSAFKPRRSRHPFNWVERAAMLRLMLTPEENARVEFVAMRDYFYDEMWLDEVIKAVTARVPEGHTIKLIQAVKDIHGQYQTMFPKSWQVVAGEVLKTFSATDLRSVFFNADLPTELALETLKDKTSPAVLAYLSAWKQGHPTEYAYVANEIVAVAESRAKKQCAYEFRDLCSDVLIQHGNAIVLIERIGKIGKGLLALPGGHVDPGETFWMAALREASEEINLRMAASLLKSKLKTSLLLDAPERSEAGRVVSMLYHFDFSGDIMPHLKAGDDAGRIVNDGRVNIESLGELEPYFHDDHFMALYQLFGFKLVDWQQRYETDLGHAV